MFLYHQWKAVDQSFPMVSWLMFGSKYWPQTSQSPIVTLQLLAASVFSMSLTKIYIAISQPRPVLKLYHQFVCGLNSLLLWFQRQVWLADGVVSWWHNTMSNWRQKGWIGGDYFHLLQAPFGAAMAKNIVRMHRLDLVLRRVRHRHHIGPCHCSISSMYGWCNVH
jgi:hypothetical protein